MGAVCGRVDRQTFWCVVLGALWCGAGGVVVGADRVRVVGWRWGYVLV